MNEFAIKSLENGRLRAYAVLFGSATKTDLANEYFDSDSDLWLDKWEKIPMIYDHGTNDALKGASAVVGYWDSKGTDDIGAWVEGELDKAHQYKSHIEGLIAKGALKTSSDSLLHLLVKETQANGAVKLVQWPLAGVSLTTTPCEHRMLPVAAVKSFFEEIGQEAGAEVTEEKPVAAKSEELGDENSFDALNLLDGLTVSQLGQVALAATKSYSSRMTEVKAMRVAAKRNFPTAAKRTEIEEMATALESDAAALKSLLEPTAEIEEPPALPTASSFRLESLRRAARLRPLLSSIGD